MGRKILTVDDSKTIRMIVAKAFKTFDCEVLEGSNGVEGLAVATREKPDVIVLDFTMPIMDGYEMLAKLKSDPDLKSIPVIMLTAEAGREQVLKIAKLGVRDYLIKPFKEEVIIERVSRVIDLKPRGEAVAKIRNFDDEIQLLIVDDKPAIIDQVRNGLADTKWKVDGANAPGQAMDFCGHTLPDVILASLTLPDNGGYSLFQTLRGGVKTKSLPIFGLTVKTDTDQQSKAQQSGFTGVITKPIEFEDLKTKICRTLNLDTSLRYFLQKDGALVMTLPADFSQGVANEVAMYLANKITLAVDAGIDKMVMDLSQLKKADITLIKLGLSTIQMCHELSIKYSMIGSEAVCQECKNYEETKDWRLVMSYQEAMSQLGVKLQVAA
ncbi:MAG: response regulator [Verrucomicrobia bacterium]|nr:response regulator [Verrucomicrobiota bacterium]MBI3868797.1 response regulator [Verrucomicrobiota bacterium]